VPADLQLDYDNDVGTGRDTTVRFLGVPILHSPWMSFALNDERRSGFLMPTYGSSNNSGFMISVPYYWNIAPNMDATFNPGCSRNAGCSSAASFAISTRPLVGSTTAGNRRVPAE
jgi:LPS-assembly protein